MSANKKIKITNVAMKYIVYGIIYYVIISEDIDIKDFDLETYFFTLWNLVTFNFDGFMKGFKACCPCFSSCCTKPEAV
jgi:hypothetical protein